MTIEHKNGLILKVTIGVLLSAVLTSMGTTMVNRLGMPTREDVLTIVHAEIGDHGTEAHADAATHKEVADTLATATDDVSAALREVRGDIHVLTMEVGKLIGRLDSDVAARKE